jgi:hypothetical protein
MPLKLIAFNPSKRRKKTKRAKARNKKRRGFFGRARKRARTPVTSSPKRAKGSTMAKKKGRRRGKRRGILSRFTANSNTPPAGRRRRRGGGSGGGGGSGFSLKNALSVRTLTEGLIVGAAVVGSNIATHKIVQKFKPDLAQNPWLMSAAQVAIGIAGTAILRAIGQGKYASQFMTGATAGAAMNAYGAWDAQRKANANGGQVVAGMHGLSNYGGPSQSPAFFPSTPSRVRVAG